MPTCPVTHSTFRACARLQGGRRATPCELGTGVHTHGACVHGFGDVDRARGQAPERGARPPQPSRVVLPSLGRCCAQQGQPSQGHLRGCPNVVRYRRGDFETWVCPQPLQ